jgi:hypothetical protein
VKRLLLLATLVAAFPSAGGHAADTSLPLLPPAARAGQTVFYGHVRSLTPRGGRFEMRFDPAWWLTGVAAERAAVQDKAIRPGEAVPNDYYIVEAGHRLLTCPVPASATVTVLNRRALPQSMPTTVAKLAQLVRSGTSNGFWIRLDKRGSVISLDQQYQP